MRYEAQQRAPLLKALESREVLPAGEHEHQAMELPESWSLQELFLEWLPCCLTWEYVESG